MTKRTKENLGFLLLGGALSILFMELTVLNQNTKIEQQAEIIDAYDQYWHAIEDQDMLQVIDRYDTDDETLVNYEKVRENLVEITNWYESNPKHIHQ